MAANCQERLASSILAERILLGAALFNCNNNGAVGATVLHTRHAELQAHVHGNAWKTTAVGNWTRVFRVTGGNTNHYITTALKQLDPPPCSQTHCQAHWVCILILMLISTRNVWVVIVCWLWIWLWVWFVWFAYYLIRCCVFMYMHLFNSICIRMLMLAVDVDV